MTIFRLELQACLLRSPSNITFFPLPRQKSQKYSPSADTLSPKKPRKYYYFCDFFWPPSWVTYSTIAPLFPVIYLINSHKQTRWRKRWVTRPFLLTKPRFGREVINLNYSSCFILKEQLQLALQELESAKTIISLLTFLFSKVLRALTPSGHNGPVCWDVDNCDKKTRNIFFTSLLHEIELVNRMSDD